MNRISMVRAYVFSAVVLGLLLAPLPTMAADPAPTENPAAGEVVIESAPAAVNATAPDPAKKDGDVIISEGQDLAIKGALTGDRLMVRAGRRMIRDGALLKRSQQQAQ